MRHALTICGTLLILAYAGLGAWAINDWGVSAASGLPLSQTIETMEAAGEAYTALPGIEFLCAGIVLGLTWGLLTYGLPKQMPTWVAVGIWSLIVTMGAPAYFFMSFANLNAVGDAIPQWNSDASFAIACGFYVASLVALIVGVWALVVGIRASTHPVAPAPTMGSPANQAANTNDGS